MKIQARELLVALASAPFLGGTLAAQVVHAGETVATYCPDIIGPGGTPDPNGACVIVAASTGIGPLDANWFCPLFHNASGDQAEVWNHSNLGTVFGIALDDHSNIFVTATTVYGDYGAATFGPEGGGAVYRIDGVTGNIDPWMTTGSGAIGTNELPNPPGSMGETPPGLGDICYDPYFDQFFVSDFADGRIYQVEDVNSQGIITDVHDPFDSYPYPGNPVFAPIGERVWAVHVTKVPMRVGGLLVPRPALLFSVWLRDGARQTTPWPAGWGPQPFFTSPNNAIFAWELDDQGNPVAGGPGLYLVMSHLIGGSGLDLGYSNPVSDITSDRRQVYFAEKSFPDVPIPNDYGGLGYDFAHAARVTAFLKLHSVLATFPLPSTPPSAYRFRIGNHGVGWNCAGGIAVQPTTQFVLSPLWSTGDNLREGTSERIYGLQRTPGTGNQFHNPVTKYCNLIDLDGNVTYGAKSQPGDVEYAAITAF